MLKVDIPIFFFSSRWLRYIHLIGITNVNKEMKPCSKELVNIFMFVAYMVRGKMHPYTYSFIIFSFVAVLLRVSTKKKWNQAPRSILYSYLSSHPLLVLAKNHKEIWERQSTWRKKPTLNKSLVNVCYMIMWIHERIKTITKM